MNIILRNKYAGLLLYLSIFIVDFCAMKASMEMGKNFKGTTLNGNEFAEAKKKLLQLNQFRSYFFTLWTFSTQLVFLTFALLDETAKILNLPVAIQKRLSRFRAIMFNTFVFPWSLLVCSIFWTVWHIDRELIFPKIIDTFYPNWLNHTLHTFILVPLLVEILLPKRYNFVKFKEAAIALLVFTFVYQILYISIYFRHGVWLYGFYGVLDWNQRIIFGIFQLILLLVFLKIGLFIQNSKRLEKAKIK